jgi:hypothetical protein
MRPPAPGLLSTITVLPVTLAKRFGQRARPGVEGVARADGDDDADDIGLGKGRAGNQRGRQGCAAARG